MRKRKALPPRTPAQEARRRMLLAPIAIRSISGKSWGGRLITHTDPPTEGWRLFTLDEEDLVALGLLDGPGEE